eukprot:scaffold40480_cov137-Amphora_coffeaeformis.AAC.1
MKLSIRVYVSVCCASVLVSAFTQPQSTTTASRASQSPLSSPNGGTTTLYYLGSTVSSSASQRRLSVLLAKEDGDLDEDKIDISEVAKEAEEALKAADAALETPKAEPPKAVAPPTPKGPPKPPAPPRKALSPEAQKDVLYAGVGAALVGGVAGSAILASNAAAVSSFLTENQFDADLGFAIPVASAALFSGAIATLASKENTAGDLARTAFGKTTKAITNGAVEIVKASATKTVKTI